MKHITRSINKAFNDTKNLVDLLNHVAISQFDLEHDKPAYQPLPEKNNKFNTKRQPG
jgi:hypothetical protein